jgi:putative SOS response-associated peptidase YedK
MCYSARIWASYKDYCRTYGATVDIHEFVRIFELRRDGHAIQIPKGVCDAFRDPQNAEERHIAAMIEDFNKARAQELEQELFKQRTGLANAQRALETKVTKKAQEDLRIAPNKISQALRQLDDLGRTTPAEKDAQMFPNTFVPVLTLTSTGDYVVTPMRYNCRPRGMPASIDKELGTLYNARRDNLQKFWARQFGTTHAIIVAECFFEKVARSRYERRELAPGEKEDYLTLQFQPGDNMLMEIACVFSHWSGAKEPDLNSFAVITDEPPEEVQAAGHDRCPIPLQHSNVRARPEAGPAHSVKELDGMLEDRRRPYYQHQLAAWHTASASNHAAIAKPICRRCCGSRDSTEPGRVNRARSCTAFQRVRPREHLPDMRPFAPQVAARRPRLSDGASPAGHQPGHLAWF